MLKTVQRHITGLLLVLFVFTSCSVEDDTPAPEASSTLFLTQEIVTDQSLKVNPSGVAPLTAMLRFSTSEAVSTRLRVVGKHGPTSDVIKDFSEASKVHEIPILGLYADHNNTIEITLVDRNHNSLGTSTFNIQTAPLIADMPLISIDKNEPQKEAGMTFVSYFGHNGSVTPQRPFIFDEFGDIRWYLTFRTNAMLSGLFYDNGMERLRNGNYYFGDRSSGRIVEIDILGQVVNSWPLPGYSFHHEVYEKPNGNFLVTVDNNRVNTVEDHIIEIDRQSGEVIREWDLRQSLQPERTTWDNDPQDWIHVNAVTYDENDDTIIISGRLQGTVKLTNDNEVVWIIAPHQGWQTAGNGVNLYSKLLQPLDASGQRISQQAVLNGEANTTDFEWAWYQHSPQVMPNGNILLFDNGENRNYQTTGTYSQAIEYEIDAANMTIRQVWAYGKERSSETYSPIVSDVDYHANSNHVFFSPGAITHNTNHGKVIEVDYNSGQVLFEATITPPVAPFNITLHRTERLSLYPD